MKGTLDYSVFKHCKISKFLAYLVVSNPNWCIKAALIFLLCALSQQAQHMGTREKFGLP